MAIWIDTEEERQRLTMEAMDDVTAGRVIDYKAVQEWAESLSTKNDTGEFQKVKRLEGIRVRRLEGKKVKLERTRTGRRHRMDKLKHKPVTHDHKAFLKNAHKREGFTKAYNEFEKEYSLINAMLSARTKSDLTQEAVADLMGTTKKGEIV